MAASKLADARLSELRMMLMLCVGQKTLLIGCAEVTLTSTLTCSSGFEENFSVFSG